MNKGTTRFLIIFRLILGFIFYPIVTSVVFLSLCCIVAALILAYFVKDAILDK